MKAEEKSFSFMNASCYYDIPFFQRAYVWDEENWQELLANFFDQSESHFLGSIILKQEYGMPGSNARYMIIDGQQRLTTLSILARACYDRMMEEKEKYSPAITDKWKSSFEQLLFIVPDVLSDKVDVKIQHSKLDFQAFNDVIKGNYQDYIDHDGVFKETYNSEGNKIISCYLYFRKELHSRSIEEVSKVWILLTTNNSSYLVNIALSADENEQKIFDTVNSFGVRLSSSDTIKNAIFQMYIEALRRDKVKFPNDLAIKLYEKTWEEAFESDADNKDYWETTRRYGRLSRDNLEVFLYAFSVVKLFFNPAEDNISSLANKYKEYLGKLDKEGVEIFLKDIKDYAATYRKYFNNFDNDCLFNFTEYKLRLLHFCHTLDVATFYPYILKLLYQNEISKELSNTELQTLFKQLESYIVLNAICNGSTKNYNNECIQLVRERRTPEELRLACSYISRRRFNEGLRNMRQSKIPTAILFWVELYDRQNDYSDIKDLKYDYTLEHIMPQKWQKNWTIDSIPVLREDGSVVNNKTEATEIRNNAVYEIGNMTLLNSKLNTSLSNSTFEKKVNGDSKKYKRCMRTMADLYLTKEVVSESEWNEAKIRKRTLEIQEKIEGIWGIEFDDEKPVHIELNEDDMYQTYDQIMNEIKTYIDAAEYFKRSDLKKDDKAKMFGFLFQEYYDNNILGRLQYAKDGILFDSSAINLLKLIGEHAEPAEQDRINILLAINDRNLEKSIDLVAEVLNDIKNKYGDIRECDFFDYGFSLVKNRFNNYYSNLLELIRGEKCEKVISDLCEILDDYYESDYDEQIELLKPIYEEHKESTLVSFLLGEAYYNLKNWTGAVQCFEKCVNTKEYIVCPFNLLLFELAFAASKCHDSQKAIGYYNQLVQIVPNNAIALNNLGYEYYCVKNYDEAIEFYQKALSIDKNQVYAANNMANALAKAGRLDELKKYIDNPPRKLRKEVLTNARKVLGGL